MQRMTFAAAMLLAASASAADGPVRFRADARVELDADGKPTRIEVSKDLPEAIRGYIEKRVAGYTYSPPERDGVRGPAVTYLSLRACAVPAAGGYRLGLDFWGNGARLATPGGRIPVLPYPASARRAGGPTVTMKIEFLIEPDGKATFQQVTYADGGSHRRDGFDSLARDWVGLLKFDPEELAGHPVRSKASIQLTYKIVTGRGPGTEPDAEASALQSRECRMAAGQEDGPMPVVEDSPIRILKTS